MHRAVVPNLGSPDVLGLQLPEALASTANGKGFWELQFKNIWNSVLGTTVLEHLNTHKKRANRRRKPQRERLSIACKGAPLFCTSCRHFDRTANKMQAGLLSCLPGWPLKESRPRFLRMTSQQVNASELHYPCCILIP